MVMVGAKNLNKSQDNTKMCMSLDREKKPNYPKDTQTPQECVHMLLDS